jgi:hypothetical protein
LGKAQAAEDPFELADRINARASAIANARVRLENQKIGRFCEDIQAEAGPENVSAQCLDQRARCQEIIEEAFEARANADIAACQPALDEGIGQNCFAELVSTGAGQACLDDSTPGKECLGDISFATLRAEEVENYSAALTETCQPLPTPTAEPTPPVQNDEDEDNDLIVDENGAADGVAGGCTLGGTGTAGDFWNLFWLVVPMLGLRRRSK